jgi:acyl-coenzyme A synthetase/AMP-(fatty) acid ligase
LPCVEKVLVAKKNSYTIPMKEGPMVTATSRRCLDNNVAEIMDAEDPLFILYTSGSTGNQKVWFTLLQAIWYILPIRLRMFLIMKKMIFFGALLILVGLLDTPIFFGLY